MGLIRSDYLMDMSEENNNTDKEVNDSVTSISKSNVLMAVVKNAGNDLFTIGSN